MQTMQTKSRDSLALKVRNVVFVTIAVASILVVLLTVGLRIWGGSLYANNGISCESRLQAPPGQVCCLVGSQYIYVSGSTCPAPCTSANCCGGVDMSRAFMSGCCNNKIFSTDTQSCCSGTIIYRVGQICCSGQVKTGTSCTPTPPPLPPCGTGTYDPSKGQSCCPGANKGYVKATQVCCNKKVGTGNACCGGSSTGVSGSTPYNKANQICCVIDKPYIKPKLTGDCTNTNSGITGFTLSTTATSDGRCPVMNAGMTGLITTLSKYGCRGVVTSILNGCHNSYGDHEQGTAIDIGMSNLACFSNSLNPIKLYPGYCSGAHPTWPCGNNMSGKCVNEGSHLHCRL